MQGQFLRIKKIKKIKKKNFGQGSPAVKHLHGGMSWLYQFIIT